MRIHACFCLILAGCFDAPAPACGFACGPSGQCPSGYECDSAGDSRCHPVGAEDPQCEAADDDDVRDPRPRVKSTALPPLVDPSLTEFDILFSGPVNGVGKATVLFARDDGAPVSYRVMYDGAGAGRVTLDDLFVVDHTYALDVGGDIFDGDGYRLIPFHTTCDVVQEAPID